MNFKDITSDDPRWSAKEKLVFDHLFRTRKRYFDERRQAEAYGVGKAIYIMANVLEACVESKSTLPAPFQDLL